MSRVRLKKSAAIILSGLLFLMGCSPHEDSSSNGAPLAPPVDPQVELTEISMEGCLNLATYINTLKTSLGNRPARRITTNVQFRPFQGHHLSRNFALRTALGNFMVDDITLNQVEEFQSMTQTNCDTVSIMTTSGPEEAKITEKGKDFVTIENEWKRQITFRWISPTSVRVTSRYEGGDFLCHEKTKVQIFVTRDIDWSDEVLFQDSLDVRAINNDYLHLLLEATGYPRQRLYNTGADLPPYLPPPSDSLPPSQPSQPPVDETQPPLDDTDDSDEPVDPEVEPEVDPVPPTQPEQPVSPVEPQPVVGVRTHFHLLENEDTVVSEPRILFSSLQEMAALPIRPGLDMCHSF